MEKCTLKALYVAKNIPISKIKGKLPYKEVSLTKETAIYSMGKGVLYVYSFGSIVLLDISSAQEREIIDRLKNLVLSIKEKAITEDYEVVQDSKSRKFVVTSSMVVLRKLEPGMLKVIARVLAQSAALESYEYEFDIIEERFSMLNSHLEKYGGLRMSGKDIMRTIAMNNGIMKEIVSGIGVLEKPDSAWESPVIDSLHSRLVDEFELEERFENLESKMHFVQDNYRLFMQSLSDKHAARLEWIIIILIAVEIILFLYELFHSGVI
ncbi:MAG: RMD1 family protein [Candidatus Woesearchaeota archaeon]